MTAPSLSCPCARPSATFASRSDLTLHLVDDHGVNRARAAWLARRIETKEVLSPADLAALGAPIVCRPLPGFGEKAEIATRSVVEANGLPDDAALNRAIADAKANGALSASQNREPERPKGKTRAPVTVAQQGASAPPVRPDSKPARSQEKAMPDPQCRKCHKPFRRRGNRQVYCDGCAAGKCLSCRRVEGHSDGCSRGKHTPGGGSHEARQARA